MFFNSPFKIFALTGICLFIGIAQPDKVRADSPLTSTDLAIAYQDLPIVRLAQQEKKVQGRILTFLLGNAPNDQKAAVINALGTRFEGQNNANLFLVGLAQEKRIPLDRITLNDLSSSDRFVLGYLLAMDTYLELSPLRPNATDDLWGASPLELISQAAFALPNDFTVHFIYALVQGQSDFSSSWCSIYLAPNLVLKLFPQPRRNMRQDAINSAMDYINLYRPNCEK
ncbi:conserved hypothetical protein [Gloeothece citriformis PCC 7424]|uniref:Uncharacterized protein n=1 Tax=Gloeothece citriformis (strain PCC 7424) TaxID=65393 RepID=B7KFC4_GLOC7|nr:hypothetical protein [Gloeothece citriformis]ACK71840.1 conserved hypothetical protein [Gloeothece citriformis PCC 7424]